MARIAMNEKTIADYMKRNKCSREEAIDLIKYDNDVEDGNDTEYDLTPEQEQVVKSTMRKTEHKVKKERKAPVRKPDELKEAIIAEIADFLREDAQNQVYEDVTVENKSRLISFTVGDTAFDLTLIKKRAKK